MMLLGLILHVAAPSPVPAIACGALRDERHASWNLHVAAAPDGVEGPFKLAPPAPSPSDAGTVKKPDAPALRPIEKAPDAA